MSYSLREIEAIREQAAAWAREVLQADVLLLDTETTGFDKAEVVEVSVTRASGEVLLNTLVQPTCSIPEKAISVHGITDEMVKDAPSFPIVYLLLKQLITDRQVVIYNASFDVGILRYCCELHDLPELQYEAVCLMDKYSRWVGEVRGNGFRWQKLPSASHRSLGDCTAMSDLLHKMSEGLL